MNVLHATGELLSIRPYHRRLGLLGARRAPVAWQRLDYGGHARQYALYATQRDDADAPVAVYLHGGGWQFGSPELLQEFGAYFYRRGYHVLMLSHRRLFRYHGEDVLADVVAGMRACFRDSGPLPYSPAPRQVLLAGVSAGGNLAALLALRQNLWREAGTEVAGLICCAAPLSLGAMGGSPTRERFAGRPNGRRWGQLDPVRYLREAPDFSAVVVHGERDGLVPVGCSRGFVARAIDHGWDDFTYVELEGGGHLSAAQWIFEA